MIHSEGHLATNGKADTQLFSQSWLPETAPRAILLVVHGMAEHSTRYNDLAAYFTARGFGLYGLDHEGHGRSTGARGHINQFADFHLGLQALLNRATEAHPGIPVFLLGHSMGALIGATFLLEQQSAFAGGILSGLALKTEATPTGATRLLTRLLSKVWPQLGILQLNADGVSRDPAVVADYIADPLVHSGKISARLVNEMLVTMEKLEQQAPTLQLPLLVMHGEADSLTAAEGSRLFHQRVNSADKALHVYPELYHEIFNEPERDQVFADVASWLQSHLPSEPSTAV